MLNETITNIYPMNLATDHTYQVTDVCAEKRDRFYNLGISVGCLIQIKFIQPMEGPIVIEVQGRLIALRKQEFECLKLR